MDYSLTPPYAPLWKKYRPVLIKLMQDAKICPQQYKLFEHEVRAIVSTAKNPAFTMRVSEGKTVSATKDSVMARDLLQMLHTSAKAQELMELAAYEFTLKRDYTLHVNIAETI